MLTQKAVRKYTSGPHTEMNGHAMQIVFETLNSEATKSIIGRTLSRYGLRSIDPAEWYPAQIVLDLYHDLAKNGWGKYDLVTVGVQMAEHAPMPEDVETIPHAMEMLNADYGMDMRNFPEEEGYAVEYLSRRRLLVHDRTPFPHDVVYGMILGLAERFCPSDGDLAIHRSYYTPTDPDADGAVYDVAW